MWIKWVSFSVHQALDEFGADILIDIEEEVPSFFGVLRSQNSN